MMKTLLDNLFGGNSPLYYNYGSTFSSSRVEETDKSYIIRTLAWGYEKDEIEIKIDGDYLVISGKSDTKSDWNSNLYEKFRFPRNIGKDSIKATLLNGILKVEVEKTSPKNENNIILVE